MLTGAHRCSQVLAGGGDRFSAILIWIVFLDNGEGCSVSSNILFSEGSLSTKSISKDLTLV